MTGVEVGPGITAAQKMWRMFRAIEDMLLCNSYSAILIEIQVNRNILLKALVGLKCFN